MSHCKGSLILQGLYEGCVILLMLSDFAKQAAKYVQRTAKTKVDFKGRREQAAKQDDGAHSKGIELGVVLDSAGGEGGQKGYG